ncbi:hypothetical protein L3X38_042329 [Prunus dulcis]|uniref:Uncharacterized protein n=1 Tax=Prunus dulcis TaxID=3755 RepID=A0AAD4UUD0_PRUDU|nr:hypothetical protein L3X38_042329 [Prunus dulcis]
MWDFVQVAMVVTRVLEIRFCSPELRQVSATSVECLPSARERHVYLCASLFDAGCQCRDAKETVSRFKFSVSMYIIGFGQKVLAMATTTYPPPPPYYKLYKDYLQDPKLAPEPPPPI